MTNVCLLVFTAGVLLGSGMGAGESGSVFLSQRSALEVLSRQKRFNTGFMEEGRAGNLERECIEERCDLEEAREVFEDTEKTREFWGAYTDGDQCESSPCQNGARCTDAMSAYICWCQPGYNGKNCEIEIARQCDRNNGGCSHFCVVDALKQAVCECAAGWKLAQDKRSCEPQGEYPCGRLGKAVTSALSSRSIITATDRDQERSADFNMTETPESSSVNLTSEDAGPEENNTTALPAVAPGVGDLSDWDFYPTLPTILEKTSSDKRIVGGNDVIPGEVPWQVSLMNRVTRQSFCGGALLSEVWVITAAHCLTEGQVGMFFVRAGEHNLFVEEGTESDHTVSEHHVHPRYEAKRSKYNHDIALLRLHTPVVPSDQRLALCLGPRDFTEALLRDAPGSLVSGWGALRFQGPQPSVLQKVEVPHVDRTRCKTSSTERVSRFMFCAGYEKEQKDSCQGDSGGPHATRFGHTWFLTGIVSWGEECAKHGKYGIYTRVSRYFPWITNVTGIGTDNSEDDSEA
ncbi:coagulation factor IXb isoform X1 [Osmerus eperlanus]|uniref:coagulation factor IXb isoform X1 n=2 Tax=Osmerus eperlanus TaxID=29151 RepID=UPI002E14303D